MRQNLVNEIDQGLHGCRPGMLTNFYPARTNSTLSTIWCHKPTACMLNSQGLLH